jgi:hypothetical protein
MANITITIGTKTFVFINNAWTELPEIIDIVEEIVGGLAKDSPEATVVGGYESTILKLNTVTSSSIAPAKYARGLDINSKCTFCTNPITGQALVIGISESDKTKLNIYTLEHVKTDY